MKAFVAISIASLLLLLDVDSGHVQRSSNFIPCTGIYIVGDCNHNGIPLELGDVITMIGMYRGTVASPYTCECPPHSDEFVPNADPDGSCVPFELSDVVAIIAAYRGAIEPLGCQDCPPMQ